MKNKIQQYCDGVSPAEGGPDVSEVIPMKKARHSRGPWKYIPDDGTGTLPAVLSANVNKGGNFYVAQCNVDADAILCAAGPDMLETLEKLETMLSAGSLIPATIETMAGWARAAIAKAGGQ